MKSDVDDVLVKKLRDSAKNCSENAYSPYSKAKVGSSLYTEDGDIFVGCNVENGSYGGTVCAERVAIFNAVSTKGKILISWIYVYSKDGWPPCGMCRQVISEFASNKTKVVIGDEDGKEVIYNFFDLFPLSFSADELKN